MNLMFQIRFVFCLIASLALFAGCAKKAPTDGSSSHVSFTIPKTFGNNALGNAACFAVSITASDITPVEAGSCDEPYGIFGGLVPLGGTIELEAKFGNARTIDIYYVISDTGCTEFDPSQGLGQVFGSNKVWRIGRKENVDFNKPEVTVPIQIEYPANSNSLATIVNAPGNCINTPPIANLVFPAEARVVQGSTAVPESGSPLVQPGFGTTQNGSQMKVRVYDQNINMQSPTNFSGRILPVRLGEE